MVRHAKTVWDAKWSLLLGMVAAILFLAYVVPWIERQTDKTYDHLFPVAVYRAEVTKRIGSEVYVHAWGEKFRDCTCVAGSLDSYQIIQGVRFGVHEKRVAGDASCRPVGKVDLGVWVLWPVEGAEEVEMQMRHNCDGRIVRTLVARVKL